MLMAAGFDHVLHIPDKVYVLAASFLTTGVMSVAFMPTYVLAARICPSVRIMTATSFSDPLLCCCTPVYKLHTRHPSIQSSEPHVPLYCCWTEKPLKFRHPSQPLARETIVQHNAHQEEYRLMGLA